jgi:hypothetical protein
MPRSNFVPSKPAKSSMMTWSRLRGIGKSSAARVTVLLPLVGYLIIFNKNVADFLQLAAQFAGKSDAHLGISSKLMLVYVGTCAIALGQVIYSIFCPAEIKSYGHVTPYVLDATRVTKDFEYEKLENSLRNSAYKSEYLRMRDRYEKSGSPITEDQKAHVNNGILHLYFQFLNNSSWAARWCTVLCYGLGFLCLVVPSAGVFYRVMAIIFSVIGSDLGELF